MIRIKLRNGKVPFDPSRWPIFYGWIILLLVSITLLMSLPGQTIGLAAFTSHLEKAYKLTYLQLSIAYFIGTFLSGTLMKKVGRLYDIYGARILAATASFMLGVMLVYLTRVDVIALRINTMLSIQSTYVISMILATIGFFGIRFFGQGILGVVGRSMLMKWFVVRRGFANGILGVFMALGFSIAPKVFDDLILFGGWRYAWLLMAAIIGIGFFILVLVFYRDNPKDSDCVPDSIRPLEADPKRPPSLPDRDYTLKEARRTYSYWVFTLIILLHVFYLTAFTFLLESIFIEAGMDMKTAVAIFIPSAIIAVVVQMAGSTISDYIKLKYLAMLNAVAILVSMAGFTYLSRDNLNYIIIGNGIAAGCFGIITTVTFPRFFGLKHLGEITGYSMSWWVIGTSVGPLLFSFIKKFTGSFQFAGYLCMAITFVLFIMAFKADNVNEKTRSIRFWNNVKK